MPRFLLEYTTEFPNGRVLQLPGDVPIEEWPYLQFTEAPSIASTNNAVGTPIIADDGTLSDTAVMLGQWQADGVPIADPDASFTPDATYVGKKIRRRVAVEGWTLVAYSNEITVQSGSSPNPDFPFPIVLMSSVYRPTSQTTWFTPVLKFTSFSAGEIEWTTSITDPVPESQVEVVTQTGPVGEYQIFMRDPSKNNPGATPRVDFSVFQLSETARRAALRFRHRATVGSGSWSKWSAAITVPTVAPPPEPAGDKWFPASSRLKEQYEAGVVGSQGQQYQRARTWNLGVIDESKRGWILSAQDENSLRLAKNGNAGGDGDPVVWGFPRLDGYFGSKSGGLYLNTDDNAGAGLFVGVSGYFSGGGFGSNAAQIGVYVGDGTLNWARKENLTRTGGPGPFASGSSGPKKAFTDGGSPAGRCHYFGNAYDRQGTMVARRPQVPEMLTCSVFKTTKALLDADLAYAAGTTATVYADATTANRAVYTKTGASGTGSWTKGIELLTDAQRPIYVLEQHGERGVASISYQGLFKSTDGANSFQFVREFAIGTYASGQDGFYHIYVAPNGDVMIVGVRGMFLSTDGGSTFTSKYTRPASVAHFFGGSSTTVSGARIGDFSTNASGGIYQSDNVRSDPFTKPASGGVANKGLPANWNTYDLACAPTNSNWLLTTSDVEPTPLAYRSTDGGASWGAVTSSPSIPGEIDGGFRFAFLGDVARGMAGFLFCPTNANIVAGWTFQTVTHSLDGGRTFQGKRSMFFDGMHNKGWGTAPLTGTDPWKKLLSAAQDSFVATWLDGLNWMQRCGLGTGDDAFMLALKNAGAGDKGYVSSNCGVLLANNRVVCAANRSTGSQSNVMVVLSNRNAADGKYPNYIVKNLSGKTTVAFRSEWSLANPTGYAFVGRWGIGNVGAADANDITFTDHGGHEFVGQQMDGATEVSFWSGAGQNPNTIYRSTDPQGDTQTLWHTTSGTFWQRAICVDPHTPERVLYVSSNDKSVIREVKRVSGSLVDSTLKLASGAAVDFVPLIETDFADRIPGGATLPATSFADVSTLISDPNMSGLFYAIVGVHGIPNLWMTVDNGLHWTNIAENLPRTLWYGHVHPLTGDLIVDSSLGRHVLPPPAGYPNITHKGKLSAQLAVFYAASTMPPVF